MFKAWIAACVLGAAALQAGEQEMNKALADWQGRLDEYTAACRAAKGAAPAPPDPAEIAPALWAAVSAKNGTKQVQIPLTPEERKRKATPRTKTAPAYEYEAPWAAPAVAWLLSHPAALASLYPDSPRRAARTAETLLRTVETTHYRSPAIADACAALAEGDGVVTLPLLRRIFQENPDRKARGLAAVAMSLMMENPDVALSEGDNARTLQVYYMRQALLLCPEGTLYNGTPVERVAEEQVYRLKHLVPGGIPPIVKVQDLQGQASVFPVKGKATLLLFWTPEEEVGTNIVRKQALMQQEYPGLVFCPITAPGEAARQAITDAGVENTYLDNEAAVVSRAFRVPSVPWAVLITPKGHVAYYGYPNLQLQAALPEALRQAETPKKTDSPRESVRIEGAPAAPAAPAPASPTAPGDETGAPALREMPEDLD